jgi:hypothetical protein
MAGGSHMPPHTTVRVKKDGSAINSSQMDAALHPARNERELMRRAGLHPHNHHQDNVGFIREKQLEVAAKKAHAEQEAQRIPEQRRRARELAVGTAQRISAAAPDPTRRPSNPTAAANAARQQAMERHGSYGKMPAYLAERNRAKEAEEQLARDEAAKLAGCPPGNDCPRHRPAPRVIPAARAVIPSAHRFP